MGDIYVSSVEGHHVTRYGTGTLIGAEVDLKHPGNLRFDTKKVVRIPEAEYALYKREYDHLFETGSLKKRAEADYSAFQAALEKRLNDEAAKAKAEAENAEVEAKLTDAKDPKPTKQESK